MTRPIKLVLAKMQEDQSYHNLKFELLFVSNKMLQILHNNIFQDSKMLPVFTICPWTAFKSRGFHFSKQMFETQTFTEEDLLNKSMLVSKYSDPEFINVKVTKSVTRGKCFTIKILKLLQLADSFLLILKRTWDLIVFIHNEGDEFWLSSSPYFVLPNKFRLNIKNDKESAMTEIKIAEKQVEFLPKKARTCNLTYSGNNRDSILKDSMDYR